MAHHFFMADKTGAGQTGAGFYSVMMRSLLMVCLLLGLPALALAQSALGASEGGTGVNLAAVKAQVEGLKLELNQIEAGLERRALSTEVLVVQRQRLDDIGIQLRKFGEELNPRAELLRSRIKELGPEPDSKAPPESPEIAKDRADRDRALKEVDELIKITRSAALQASQLVDLVVEKRREAFQAHLFERTSSLLAPGLWVDVVMGLPKDMSAFVILSTNTLGRIIDVRGLLGLALLMAGLASLVVITWLTLDVTHKIAAARFPDTNPSPFRKSLRAVFYALTGFALPTLAGFVMLEIFTSLGMVPPRLETIVLPSGARSKVAAATPEPVAKEVKEAPKAADEATISQNQAGQAWVRQMPAGTFLVQHTILLSYAEANAWLQAHPSLRRARIVANYLPNLPTLQYSVVSGPFSSLGDASAYADSPGVPKDPQIRSARFMKEQFSQDNMVGANPRRAENKR